MDKRFILAMVLCFLILVGWMWLSQKLWPPPLPAPPPKKPDATAQAPKPVPDKPDAPKPAPEPARYEAKPPILLSSNLLEVEFSNSGAGVRRMSVRFPKEADAVHLLEPFDPKIPHLALRHLGGSDLIESAPWEIVEQAADRVTFRYRLRNGVEITKAFLLDQDRHTLQLTLTLDNKNAPREGRTEPDDVILQLELAAFNALHPDSYYRYENYLMGVGRYDRSLKLLPLGQIDKGEKKLVDALKMPEGKERTEEIRKIEEEYFRISGGRKEWFGLKNRFFTAVVNPDSAALDVFDREYYSFRSMTADGHPNMVATARTDEMHLSGRKVLQFTVYGGPLEKTALRDSRIPGLDDLAGYTGGCYLGFIVKPAAAVILELLRFTGRFLNMGLAIIVTTLLIRLCLFPLSLKSQRTALAMTSLAPKIQALKERYKDDQQKYNVEQIRLFKEHKVNPAAGCLPVFIQMPIFIGMYSVFEMSIELRRAPFFLWIRDLSEPDRLFGGNWGVDIPMPLIPNIQISAFNLLPILMMITWFLQAYFTPRSPDPQTAQQQKMMMWMPIVFGLSCYGLASGLSLYFLANSLLSMAEQKIIKKYILKVPSPGQPPTTTNTVGMK